MNFGEKLMNSFFSGVTARTAGYNSISVEGMSDFSKLGTCIFMFIGASPASTGGGIKTTTVLVLIMTVVSYLRSKNDVELLGHKIDKLAVYRTLTVTLLSLMAVILCFSVLYFTLPEDVSGVDCLHPRQDTADDNHVHRQSRTSLAGALDADERKTQEHSAPGGADNCRVTPCITVFHYPVGTRKGRPRAFIADRERNSYGN